MKEEYLVVKKDLNVLFDKIRANFPEVSIIITAAFPDKDKDYTNNMLAAYGHPVDIAVLIDHLIQNNPSLVPILMAMSTSRHYDAGSMTPAINEKPV